jgi:uncharacterized membrane protein YdjX (TVP38/TMEM64 family)
VARDPNAGVDVNRKEKRAKAVSPLKSSNRCSSWHEIVLLLVVPVVLLVPAVVLIARGPSILGFYRDREGIASFVRGWGPWAPAVTIVLHIAQVLFAPIPGQALDAVNGYLFGPWLGALFSMVGLGSGSILAMALARCFGRPLVERLVDRQALHRLDDRVQQHGRWFILAVFLFPFLPDDVMCFLAGLTSIPLYELALLAMVGRFPGVFVASWFGSRITHLSTITLSVLLACLLVGGLTAWHYRTSIESALLGLSERLSTLVGRLSKGKDQSGRK